MDYVPDVSVVNAAANFGVEMCRLVNSCVHIVLFWKGTELGRYSRDLWPVYTSAYTQQLTNLHTSTRRRSQNALPKLRQHRPRPQGINPRMKLMVLDPRWGLTPRQTDRLTIGRNIILYLILAWVWRIPEPSDRKIWSWVKWGSEPRMAVLARASSNVGVIQSVSQLSQLQPWVIGTSMVSSRNLAAPSEDGNLATTGKHIEDCVCVLRYSDLHRA
jgi:hypothetical protein